MKWELTLTGCLVGLMTIILAAGLTQAQGPEPPGGDMQPQEGASIQALMGTAFTYQGQLKKDGVPVNGTCDFLFSLWDDPTAGSQIGTNQEKSNVSVSNGLFTIPDLDFGAGAFNGDARWLRVRVRCPAGSGSYIVLDPRQLITPAPYALALPGLWTEQTATSPNLIGGYSGNSVTSGVAGATIGGGGAISYANRVTDDYGAIGGGRNNQVGDNAGSTSDRPYATVGGGWSNAASGAAATLGGGSSNVASGGVATVGGGFLNHATGDYATIGGGHGNTASGLYATVPGGYFAGATHYGEIAYASGRFFAVGDAQTSLYVARIERVCTAGTWMDLYLDGNAASAANYLTIPLNRTVAFEALVVGRSNAGESAGYLIRGVIENVGGTVSMVGTSPVTVIAEDDSVWDVRAVAAFGALFFQVQGNGETIRWVASIRTAEVSW